MGKKRVLIGYGVDVDAVSGWLGSYGGEDSSNDISRGKESQKASSRAAERRGATLRALTELVATKLKLTIEFGTGLFAGTVGVRRMLKLFAKYDIKTTWFIPGHSLETFPEEMAAVRDAGHEIGLHGYSHENPTDMSLEQQRDVLDKTYKMLTEFVGKPPRGSVAPW